MLLQRNVINDVLFEWKCGEWQGWIVLLIVG